MVAASLAAVAVLTGVRAARVTRRNLSLCYPGLTPAARRRLTFESLRQTALILLEAGIVVRASAPEIDDLILEVRGVDRLEEALSTGRGVLMLGPHYGNWELLNIYLGRYGMVALFDPPRRQWIADALKSARERTGSKLLSLDHRGLRRACEVLQQGGLLGLLPDQVPDRKSGIYVPFFGRPALTMTLAHRLIRRYRPAVLMAFARREGAGFVVEIRPVREEVTAPDPAMATAAMNRSIEDVIREDPCQYQWEYKRFKNETPGAPRAY